MRGGAAAEQMLKNLMNGVVRLSKYILQPATRNSQLVTMNTRNIIAIVLILISLACLFPGLFYDMMTIKVGAELPLVGTLTIHETTQSILNTIKTLHQNDNSLVAGLILLFSVVIPVLKAILLMIVLFFKKAGNRLGIYKFVALIGKWSMADVFVVGVMLAFLATRSDDNVEAILHAGFYYFLAYCIISVLAIQIMDVKALGLDD